MPITLDPEVLKVAEYVYETLLSKPYTEVGDNWRYDFKKPFATKARGDGHNLQCFIKVGEQILHRPIHGLAHTMRTLMYSQLMYESAQRQDKPHVCRDGRTIADLTPLDLKKLNIAQLFFVAGRESEASYGDAYHRYHDYGAKHFDSYARRHLTHLFSEEEIDLYARCIQDREGDSFDFTAEAYLIHLSHMIDLMRCKSPVEVFLGHTRGSLGIVPNLIHLFGHDDGLDIMHFARGLFAATGEGVPYIDSSEWSKLGVDLERAVRAQELTGPLNVEGQEADGQKTARAGLSVTGCYEALCTVDTPKWFQQKTIEEKLLDKDIEIKEMQYDDEPSIVITLPPEQRKASKKENLIEDESGCLTLLIRQLFWKRPTTKTDPEQNIEQNVVDVKTQLK